MGIFQKPNTLLLDIEPSLTYQNKNMIGLEQSMEKKKFQKSQVTRE